MLFFCPLDNATATPTTLAEQQAAIAADGTRARHGLCVDAPSPCAAADTLRAYLLDCHRSGRPGYAPTVELEDREGVPVAMLIDNAPSPCASEAAAISAMIATAARKQAAPANAGGMRPNGGSMPPAASGMPEDMGGMPPEKNAKPEHFAIDDDNRSAPV